MARREESLALSFFVALAQLLVITLLVDVRKSDGVHAFIGGSSSSDATLIGRRRRRRQSITYLGTSTGDNDSSGGGGGGGSVGPKADSANRRRRSSDRRPRGESSSSSETTASSTSRGPRDSPRPDRMARRRRTAVAAVTATVKREEEKSIQQQPFDGKKLSAAQLSNLDAPSFDLRSAMLSTSSSSSSSLNNIGNLHCVTPGIRCYNEVENENHQQQNRVISSNDLRSAIRLDVFETTPFYANLPKKASSVLLLPDSSLEGSWRIPTMAGNPSSRIPRMKHTTRVLKEAFQQYDEEFGGCSSSRIDFDGDDLFRRIGEICGNGASTHWIDIYGVQNKKINHSWHLDAGISPNDCQTVLWGFPPENDYHGTGVFSHIIPLDHEFNDIVNMNDDDNAGVENTPTRARHRMEPILYEGTVDEKYIVRPSYESGKELLIYRDVDVLHSAPDVTYRASVMRFM
ncbi:hypothetical protein FRACYDRAFT_242903 [Fragilariopsis cylindrus CCMP1102]|uniref:Uncharacterized protein n=1 Tax=Fragilariopsis cylindrus CCMP1102 TaxID=635003 RepID=A0A1E7F4P3_9STRA|nr:hypothetical protein FRACYDRAFT_242903 [Fragilariopsis cylindrus CCMP1102]|eukprot:OEU13152.1 hypothetical protein FRACYDRAFT_242903 [Fragilariopsis cylindrus CCMP1102]